MSTKSESQSPAPALSPTKVASCGCLSKTLHRFTMKTNRLEWWETLIVIVAVALLGYFLTSCSPKVRVVPVERTRTEWRDRWRVDTINTGRIDSIRITEVVEVPAKLTAWQVWRLKAFAPLLAIALALGAWVSRRLWLPLLRGL